MNQYGQYYVQVKKVFNKYGIPVYLAKNHNSDALDTYMGADATIDTIELKAGDDFVTIIKKIADATASREVTIKSISVNGIQMVIDANKNVNIIVPTKLSDLTSDETHRVVTDEEISVWNAKQDALKFYKDNYDKLTNPAITLSDLTTEIAKFNKVTRLRGVYDKLEDVDNPQNGDIALILEDSSQHIYDGEDAQWWEFGNPNLYILHGAVTNDEVPDNAAIAQSKISGLVDALAGKVAIEVGKSLVLDTEIAKIHSHENKTTLDTIDQTSWDTVVTNSNQVPNKVDKSTTIAGVNLQDNVTKEEMLAALNVEDGAQVNKIETIKLNGTDLTIDSTTKKASGLVKSTLPIPNEISYTVMTSLQFCNAICDLDTCKVGVIYCGYSKISDAPCNGCEVTVSVMKDESTTYLPRAKVLILKMNSTNNREKNWITMYHNQEMKFGTFDCPWEAELLTPVSTSDDSNDWIGASRKYVNDSIKSAIQSIIYEDAQGGHIKISNNYTLNISPTGVITATYPTV